MKDCNGGAYGLPLSVLQLQSQPKEVSLDQPIAVPFTAADGSIGYYAASDGLSYFDRIHLADCSAKRAALYVVDGERFSREYDAVRLWCSAAYRNR